MPGKMRHSKGKHHQQSKKNRAKQRHGTMAVQHHVPADTPEKAAAISAPTSSRASASPATPKTAQYPYISTELRRIGILAGIILVILIVLALVLS